MEEEVVVGCCIQWASFKEAGWYSLRGADWPKRAASSNVQCKETILVTLSWKVIDGAYLSVCVVWVYSRAAKRALIFEEWGGSLHLGGYRVPVLGFVKSPAALRVSLWGDRAAGSVGSDQVLVVVVSTSLRGGTVGAVLSVLTVPSSPSSLLLRGGV